MTTPLDQQHCVPCEGGVPFLTKPEALKLAAEVNGWTLSDDAKSIFREFLFTDFKGSMTFINKIADIANAEDHHPDIHCWWNKVNLELSTHAIGGLSNNDFIMASKINKLAA